MYELIFTEKATRSLKKIPKMGCLYWPYGHAGRYPALQTSPRHVMPDSFRHGRKANNTQD